MPKTLEQRFLDFLKGRLSEQVPVPKAATDVLRTVKFPSLEKRSGLSELSGSPFEGGSFPQAPEQPSLAGQAGPGQVGPGQADEMSEQLPPDSRFY